MFFLFIGARESIDSPELERFALALETAQCRYPSMTIGMLATLLRIGTTPRTRGDHVTVADVAANSPDQKYSTIARRIDLLGEGHGKSPGLGLLEKQVDINDRRLRYVAISQRGKMLLQELDLILAPDLIDSLRPSRVETKLE